MADSMCARSDCGNNGCHRYSKTYGYLCDSCFDDLIRSGHETDIVQFLSVSLDPDWLKKGFIRYDSVFQSLFEHPDLLE